MMDAMFRLNTAEGVNIIDSNYITYGLVRSGYLQPYATWDVAGGSGGVSEGWGVAVPVHVARIEGAVAPVVFTVGRSLFISINRHGNDWEFLYIAASTTTRFYAFDGMREANTDPVRFRLWNEQGQCTFNSRQWPLAIDRAIQVPPPPAIQGSSGYGDRPYREGALGAWTQALQPQRTYAANLPFNRGATLFTGTYHGADHVGLAAAGGGTFRVKAIEGAYGGKGGVTAFFYFDPFTWPLIEEIDTSRFEHWAGMYVARLPIISVVDVTDLPFPFTF